MELSPEKKNDGNLHHALRAMMYFPVIFFWVCVCVCDIPSPNKGIITLLFHLSFN
jgi:hypothetical protein